MKLTVEHDLGRGPALIKIIDRLLNSYKDKSESPVEIKFKHPYDLYVTINVGGVPVEGNLLITDDTIVITITGLAGTITGSFARGDIIKFLEEALQ